MSMYRLWSIYEKVKILSEYLDGTYGFREVCRRYNINQGSLKDWKRLYETFGLSGLKTESKTSHYSKEVKESAVRDYLSHALTVPEILKKYQIRSGTQLRKWIKVYTAHGNFNSVKFSGGGSYMKQGKSTTQEERIQIAKECYASGKNYGEVALKYNVSYQQVRAWTLRYEELGEAGLEDRRGRRKKDQAPRTELEKAQIEIERLKHELHKAEMERDLLKKLDEVMRRDVYRK